MRAPSRCSSSCRWSAFLPGFFNLPPIDRDEARFAQATKQMIETRRIRRHPLSGRGPLQKPVGIYWLQAAVVRAAEAVGVPEARTTMWLYRRALAARRHRGCAADLLGRARVHLPAQRAAGRPDDGDLRSAQHRGASRQDRRDAAALLCGCHGRHGAAPICGRATMPCPGPRPCSSWTAVGVGILLKGPLILLVAGLAAIALGLADRSARWLLRLRPLVGVLWVAVLMLPWFVAILGRAGRCVPRRVRQAGHAVEDLPAGRRPTARRPAITCCCSGSASGRPRRLRPWPRRPCGGSAANRWCGFCSPGSCRAGSCSSW